MFTYMSHTCLLTFLHMFINIFKNMFITPDLNEGCGKSVFEAGNSLGKPAGNLF